MHQSSYFILIRFLLAINLVFALIWIGLLVIPSVTNQSSPHDIFNTACLSCSPLKMTSTQASNLTTLGLVTACSANWWQVQAGKCIPSALASSIECLYRTSPYMCGFREQTPLFYGYYAPEAFSNGYDLPLAYFLVSALSIIFIASVLIVRCAQDPICCFMLFNSLTLSIDQRIFLNRMMLILKTTFIRCLQPKYSRVTTTV